MRETLRIMRMRSFIYGLSYLFTHGILSLITAVIVTVICMLKLFSFKEATIFFISVLLYGLSMISISMNLSTCFSDSKVASIIGKYVLFFPLVWFMCLYSIVFTHNNPIWMYMGYITPTPYVPAMVILGNTLNVEPYNELNMPISWIALILCILLYSCLYLCRD